VVLIAVKVFLDYRAYRQREMEASLREMRGSIRVEVLNGTDVPGLGARAGNELRKMGFDVVSVGNARDSVARTVVVERRDPDMKYARILGGAIGCKVLTVELDPDRLLEVSLVIGEDHPELFGKQGD
jgi:hypothetical protein